MHEKNSPAPRAGHAICGLGLAAFLLGAMLCFVGLAALHPGLSTPQAGAASWTRSALYIGLTLLVAGCAAFFATMRHLPVRRRIGSR